MNCVVNFMFSFCYHSTCLEYVNQFVFVGMGSVKEQQSMEAPVKVPLCHFVKDRLETPNPCIQLLTCLIKSSIMSTICYSITRTTSYLSVKCMFIVRLAICIICHSDKVGCRPIQWFWVAPFVTEIISCSMVNVMICIHNEPSGLPPREP